MAETLTKIKFGHSPDPDDAFMFYAIRHRKIDLAGFEIEHVVEDIESLNHRALNGELEATAVSVHAYGHMADTYAIMRAGASVGEQYGPIVVERREGRGGVTVGAVGARLKPGTYSMGDKPGTYSMGDEAIRGKTIAVPGKMTTAYLMLKLFEKIFREVVVPFDQIMDFVKAGKVDAGLLIHEGQITYQDHDLRKIIDLGAWWWGKTRLPLPLGVDVIRKDLGAEKMAAFARVFKESIEYALAHRNEALDDALRYGRGLRREAGDRFVGMYVNDYTRDLGSKGEEAIRELLTRGYERGLLPRKVVPEFV